MKLTQLQKQYREIATTLGGNSTLPTTPQHDGSAHAELKDGSYFFVVTERGSEYERRRTSDPQELLSWFVRVLTSQLAGDWELNNRIPSQDSRRLRFRKHVELLATINASWANDQQHEYDEILTKHPFNDSQ